ncbi:DUF4292 domain-containing protein [bacterium]|nr:DUF4292 domain-containing protein [bacterium]
MVTDFKKVSIDSKALIDTLNLRDSLLQRVSGRISIKIETDTFKNSFSADFFYSAPDSFRANIRGFVGSVPAVAVSIGDSMALFLPSKDSLYIIKEDAGINPVLGLDIGTSDLVKALIARVGLSEEPGDLIDFSTESQTIEMVFEREMELRRIEILPSAWVPTSIQIFSKNGLAILDIGYFQFVDSNGIIRPRMITITNPTRNEKIMIKIEKETLNNKLPEDIFVLPIPSDAGILYLNRSIDDN